MNNLRESLLGDEAVMHQVVVIVDKELIPLSLAKENWLNPVVLSTNDRGEVWPGKELRDRLYRTIHGRDVYFRVFYILVTFRWPIRGNQTLCMCDNDEVIKTNNYGKYNCEVVVLDTYFWLLLSC